MQQTFPSGQVDLELILFHAIIIVVKAKKNENAHEFIAPSYIFLWKSKGRDEIVITGWLGTFNFVIFDWCCVGLGRHVS